MSSKRYSTKYDYTTPERVMRPDGTAHTHLKSTTPPTIEPTRFSSTPQHHLSINVQQRSANPQFHQTEHFGQDSNRTLALYQSQINSLKNYIHSADQIDRSRIVDIFGFEYECCRRQSSESKIVLKELSSKVQDLIRENSRLKDSRTKVYASTQSDTALISENERLKSLLEEYRRSESESSQKLRKQNYSLRTEIEVLRKQIERLEGEIRKLSSERNSVQKLKTESFYTQEELQISKKALTKQMYEYTQELQIKNSKYMERIDKLEEKVNSLNRKVKDYEKERAIKIESTIRKSFILSQSLVRPGGDQHNETLDQEEIPQVKQAEFYLAARPVQMPAPPPIKQTEGAQVNESKLKSDNLQLQDRISMHELKIRSLSEQNGFLKAQISQLNGKINDKVERVIHLEDLLNKLEKDKVSYVKKSTVVNPEFEHEIRIIKDTLASCNISNFDHFFKEFNLILQQRNEMRTQIQGFASTQHLLRKTEDNKTNERKIHELTEENKRLLKKVGELESEAERYHAEIINNEIQKLSSIKFDSELMPKGNDAIEWQLKVRACIENSLNRLEALERKVANRQITTSMAYERSSPINP